jgi:hypothetical protein
MPDDSLFQLARRADSVLQSSCGVVGRDAGGDLGWAVFNLQSARVGKGLVEQMASGLAGLPAVTKVLDADWDTLEVMVMSLAFGDVKTALDLCANAVHRLAKGPTDSDDWFLSVEFWNAETIRQFPLPPSIDRWRKSLVVHPDLARLIECRNSVTHRRLPRHIVAGQRRTFSEIWQLGPAGKCLGTIGDLVPQLVEFGVDQFKELCESLSADFGVVDQGE